MNDSFRQDVKEIFADKVAEQAAVLLGTKAEEIQGLLDVQVNMCVSDYQIGLYNGLVLALSVLTGKEPVFYEQKGDSEDGISD